MLFCGLPAVLFCSAFGRLFLIAMSCPFMGLDVQVMEFILLVVNIRQGGTRFKPASCDRLHAEERSVIDQINRLAGPIKVLAQER